jgi:hypothetical protein
MKQKAKPPIRKAKLKHPILVQMPDGSVDRLDGRTALTFLHMHGAEYWFCVRKHHGTGASGLALSRSEFDWITKSGK